MFEYFLYILAQDPSEITDILNEIVSAANEIGFEVVSGIWSLKGKYETLIRKKLKKMQILNHLKVIFLQENLLG